MPEPVEYQRAAPTADIDAIGMRLLRRTWPWVLAAGVLLLVLAAVQLLGAAATLLSVSGTGTTGGRLLLFFTARNVFAAAVTAALGVLALRLALAVRHTGAGRDPAAAGRMLRRLRLYFIAVVAGLVLSLISYPLQFAVAWVVSL